MESIQGLRCERCGWETLPGDRINAVLQSVAERLRHQPDLDPDQRRYLRKHRAFAQEQMTTPARST